MSQGDQPIATARPSKGLSGEERLESLKNAGAAVLELDVTASQEDLNQKAQEAWAKYGKVDVLVNNAGYIEAGILEELEYEPDQNPQIMLTIGQRGNAPQITIG